MNHSRFCYASIICMDCIFTASPLQVCGNVFTISHKISRLLISANVTLTKANQKKGGSRIDFTEVGIGYESQGCPQSSYFEAKKILLLDFELFIGAFVAIIRRSYLVSPSNRFTVFNFLSFLCLFVPFCGSFFAFFSLIFCHFSSFFLRLLSIFVEFLVTFVDFFVHFVEFLQLFHTFFLTYFA